MTPLQSFTISGIDGGLQTDRKPYLLPDKAFPVLKNAYSWRGRTRKRECLELVGRLRKTVPLGTYFTNGFPTWNIQTLVVTGYISTVNNANPGQVTTKYPHNLVNGTIVIISNIVGAVGYNSTFVITVVDEFNFTVGVNAAAFGAYVSGGTFISSELLTATEPNAQIEPGSFQLTLNGGRVLVDNGNGLLTYNGANFGVINYQTGVIQITTDLGASLATTLTYNYFPGLPVMGIESRELATINFEQTIFFDTRYAYTFDGTNFNDIAGVAWSGTDSDFFWTTNYQGADSSIRTFFVTNDFDDLGSPMRYTQDAVTFTTFQPKLINAGAPYLLEALILIPYYGRLVALNTIEGTTLGDPANKNYFNRARFSQQGNPLQSDAWITDVFGKGGFADAPTSEQIVSATLFKNTLIVRFERSTWQLRYMGEYGSPFLFERISSDFGSESTFSSVLFDNGDLTVGDRAITVSTSNSVARVDEAIPDLVFSMLNKLAGPERVHGIRDFRRELVFWCYNDATISSATQYFPNTVLVYNYKNQSFAQFRDNITVFGNLQPATSTTWDSTNVYWEDEDITWDTVSSIAEFNKITAGNAAGYVHYYGYQTPDDAQNFITAIDLTTTPIKITVPNHNILDEETVYLSGLMFTDTNLSTAVSLTTNLNDKIYLAKYIDDNNLSLFKWDFTQNIYISNFSFTPVTTAYYVGGGQMALFPKLDVMTKDFNPFSKDGNQIKISYVDFLMDVDTDSAMSVNLYSNTYLAYTGTVVIGNRSLETDQPEPYFGNNAVNPSDILWHRFYFTLAGQMIRIQMTYSDALMNTITTHRSDWVLNAMTIWCRKAGKQVF